MNSIISKVGLLAIAAFVSHSAMASYAVECGSAVNADQGTVKDSVFQASSEDENFKGPAKSSGKRNTWSMTYKGQEYPPKKATARTIYAKGDGPGNQSEAIEITVIIGNSPSGPVGERILISKPYDDQPKMEVFNIGGVTGPMKTATYKCLSFVD